MGTGEEYCVGGKEEWHSQVKKQAAEARQMYKAGSLTGFGWFVLGGSVTPVLVWRCLEISELVEWETSSE